MSSVPCLAKAVNALLYRNLNKEMVLLSFVKALLYTCVNVLALDVIP